MNPEDILEWPDGGWCFRDELEEYGSHRSDDYQVFPGGTAHWVDLMNEYQESQIPIDAFDLGGLEDDE